MSHHWHIVRCGFFLCVSISLDFFSEILRKPDGGNILGALLSTQPLFLSFTCYFSDLFPMFSGALKSLQQIGFVTMALYI